MAGNTSRPRALVTGASGFLGTEIILILLERGFHVVAALRSAANADAWRRMHPQYTGQSLVKFVVIPDMQEDGAYDEAVQDVDIIFHTASPFNFTFQDNEKEMLVPARKGALSVLESAMKSERVQRFIFTSS